MANGTVVTRTQLAMIVLLKPPTLKQPTTQVPKDILLEVTKHIIASTQVPKNILFLAKVFFLFPFAMFRALGARSLGRGPQGPELLLLSFVLLLLLLLLLVVVVVVVAVFFFLLLMILVVVRPTAPSVLRGSRPGSRSGNRRSRLEASPRDGSEGGMMRLETLIELKFLNSSFSS